MSAHTHHLTYFFFLKMLMNFNNTLPFSLVLCLFLKFFKLLLHCPLLTNLCNLILNLTSLTHVSWSIFSWQSLQVSWCSICWKLWTRFANLQLLLADSIKRKSSPNRLLKIPFVKQTHRIFKEIHRLFFVLNNFIHWEVSIEKLLIQIIQRVVRIAILQLTRLFVH